ncbi:MAG: C25 family cysteine peptidase, partial [Methanothrix sp.]|nr:C25 family cysteine peptidase [Methanothrix sp.]
MQYLLDDPTIERGVETLTTPDGSIEIRDSVTIPGLYDRIVPGEPTVPVRTARILIPYGEEVQEIKVVPGNERYLGRVSIMPGQNSVPMGFIINCTGCQLEENWTEMPKLGLINEAIFESEIPYPEEPYSILGVMKKHGYTILYINLYPIRYIPKTGDAYSFGAFDVEVTTAPAETFNRGLLRGLPEDQELVEMIVDNPEKMTTYPSDLALTGKSLLLDGLYKYVIITNQYMKDAPGPYNFQALAEAKTLKGVPAAIVTVEEIYDAYKYSYPRDNQEAIRNFIKDVYANNGVRYVLLGGDGDGERIGGETWDAIVPTRLLWAWAYEPD